MKIGPLPLVVGVTGHRDLAADDGARVEAAIRGLFADLRRRCPHTPIVLMSSLAEGADRLVARTALDCGAQLYAVLPMSSESYERDFETAESRDEFHQLMQSSCNSIVMEPASNDPGTGRDRRYALSGAFLVSYSQIVIALWDGNREELQGGTSQIVRFALQGVPTQFRSVAAEPLHVADTGAVYHVPVGRLGKTNGAVDRSAGWLYPRTDSNEQTNRPKAAFEKNLRSLERFNRDAAKPNAVLEASDATQAYIGTLFESADAMAIRCRNWTHAALIGIFSVIGAAAALFSLYTNLFHKATWMYVGFLCLVGVAFAIDIAVKRANLQDRFQDYRALTEGLRVQFYWRLARIRESVYEHYLAHQEGELDWIRNAMRAAHLQERELLREPTNERGRQELVENVLDRWVIAQEAYFLAAAAKERCKANRLRWAANVSLIATAIVAIVLSTAVGRHMPEVFPPLVTALTLTLTSAALITGYSQKRAHDEHARRYERMRELYGVARERLGARLREHDVAGAKAVLVHLGREALAETCDWLLLHRDRQIDIPTG